MAPHLLHLNLGAEDVVFGIRRSWGLPSRAASFSPSSASTLSLSDRFCIGQGTKEAIFKVTRSSKGPIQAFTTTHQWRQFLRSGCHLHGSLSDALATLEVLLEIRPRSCVGACGESFSLRGVLLLVLFHPVVVPHPRQLVWSVDP